MRLAAVLLLSMLAAVAHAEPCVDAKDAAHIRDLMLQANDEALKAHLAKLFDIWLRDYGQDTSRARAGTLNGINAYERAVAALRRWNPPTCTKE